MSDIPMTVSSARHQFHLAHGGDEAIYIRGWFLYPDGSQMEGSPFGCTKLPPTDRRARWELILLYREELVKRTETSFEELKYQVSGRFDPKARATYVGKDYSGTREEALRELHVLRGEVINARRLLREAQVKFDRLNGPRFRTGDDCGEDDEDVCDQISNLKI